MGANSDQIGVILVNLGTPATPDTKGVRAFLKAFLSDRRVVDLPRLLWLPLLYGVILPLRSKRVANSYRQIWTDEGSPLLAFSRAQQRALAGQLAGDRYQVELAMTYGDPSLDSALERLDLAGIGRVLLLPLYPQYSVSTTAPVIDALGRCLQKRVALPEVRWIRCYFDHPGYIQALAESIRHHWLDHGRPDKLLFSFHGIPQRYARMGDPYGSQCHATANAVAKALGLTDEQWMTCFQSRFGREEWLTPYTDITLQQLAQQGCANVQVICPAFAADCLETLEEINEMNRRTFIEAGGANFGYIPCLNAEPPHIQMMSQLVEQHTAGW